MADSHSALGPLPNGWESRYDPRSRRNYFIDFVNKTTTWDDPRATLGSTGNPPTFRELGDVITMQPLLNGIPDHRNIYPFNSTHCHPQPAFHFPIPFIRETVHQDLTGYRPSPVAGRAHTAPLMGSHAIGHHSSSKIHESSFSNAVATEHSVAKIAAMFPTVSETHIRALLIKYHSREAVVISALQVEKNPLTTPGPFSTPPLARHIIIPPPLLPPNYHSTPPSAFRDFVSTPPPSLYSYGCGTGGTLTGSLASSSCMGSPAIRHSPRAHSSPKMKLRYMKSMFPKADETVILDTLYNTDNNVQAATTQLQAMGFDKRDSSLPSRAGTPSSKLKNSETPNKTDKEKLVSTPTPSARLRSVEEKQGMRDRLKRDYPDLAEQLISMALESVEYDENRAGHILKIMIKEESTSKSSHLNSASSHKTQSNKSDADGSSIETKTTVEADLPLHPIPNCGKIKKLPEEKTITVNESVTAEIPLKDENIIDSKELSSTRNVSSSKSVCTSATIHDPPSKIPIFNGNVGSPPFKVSSKKKNKKDVPKISRGTSTTEDKEYQSKYRIRPNGPNLTLHHGPNDELLIADYVTWSGPRNRVESRPILAKGPNKKLLMNSRNNVRGPNKEACKGPQRGLVKGSLYSQLAACNAVTSLVAVESRGK